MDKNTNRRTLTKKKSPGRRESRPEWGACSTERGRINIQNAGGTESLLKLVLPCHILATSQFCHRLWQNLQLPKRKNCFSFHENTIFGGFQFGSRGYRNSNFIRRLKIASPFPLKTTHQPDAFRGENSEAGKILSQSSFLSLRYRLISK